MLGRLLQRHPGARFRIFARSRRDSVMRYDRHLLILREFIEALGISEVSQAEVKRQKV